ncbi:MAG: helix-turn-helix transcriptional regulator [Monoglobus pectinilyticus]|uniref:helix-turn-helix domain-containing protein n=1 Tax=Monoglobus pectinilyticus TaxID=1981510 RepID=UPI00300F3956
MNKVEILDNEDENNLKNVGSRIQKCRKAAGLTQRQLSDITGISENHISRIEQGYHNPRFDMVIQIAKALNVPTDAFAKDLSDDNVDVFLESIRPNIEKLNVKQLEYLKKNIELLLEL